MRLLLSRGEIDRRKWFRNRKWFRYAQLRLLTFDFFKVKRLWSIDFISNRFFSLPANGRSLIAASICGALMCSGELLDALGAVVVATSVSVIEEPIVAKGGVTEPPEGVKRSLILTLGSNVDRPWKIVVVRAASI